MEFIWKLKSFQFGTKLAVFFIHLKTKNMNTEARKEGQVAKKIEEQTSKIPSDLFLWSALGSMAISATLKCIGKKHTALFVGQWAAPFLLLGIYNKIVKLEGHDKDS